MLGTSFLYLVRGENLGAVLALQVGEVDDLPVDGARERVVRHLRAHDHLQARAQRGHRHVEALGPRRIRCLQAHLGKMLRCRAGNALDVREDVDLGLVVLLPAFEGEAQEAGERKSGL